MTSAKRPGSAPLRHFLRRRAVGVAVVLFTVPAAGDPSKVAPTPAADSGLRGVEILLRPAVGGPLPDSPVRFVRAGDVPLANDPGALLRGSAPWATGFAGQLAVGYRFRPLISAGVRGGYRWTVGANLPDGSTHLTRTGWDVGFYARIFPLARVASIAPHVDPWISIGVGYQRDSQSFRRTLTNGDDANILGNVSIAHHSIAAPAALGIDIRFAPMLAIGPSIEAAIHSPIAGCVSTKTPGSAAVTYCSDAAPGRTFLEARPYLAWNAGLDVKLTF